MLRPAVAVRALLALTLLANVAPAGEPPGYYASVDPSSAASLRASLHPVIDDHIKIPYSGGFPDAWDVLEDADVDPANPARILDVYKNASYLTVGGGNSFYNREHLWPNTYGFPNDGPDNLPYTDCHQLRLSDIAYNNARGSIAFGATGAASTEYATDVNNGQGGGTGVYPGNSNWGVGMGSSGNWETWLGQRGDVARAMLYMDVRYEGGLHGVSGLPEPDLVLTDDTAAIAASSTGSNGSLAYMGRLSVLLQWHADDPVDQRERDRNDVVFAYQGNRNPFTDHPEWVDILWPSTPGGGGGTGTAWINELHYDNAGTDVGEFVEVAGAAGLDLSGWTLVAYNGNGAVVYDTVTLSGSIPDQQGCFGTKSFDLVGLQNGSPDGVALVDAGGAVIEFLSYEGSFTAVNGPAAGMLSVDIGVSELGTTPIGQSLQRQGSGDKSGFFVFAGPLTATRDAPNSLQVFAPSNWFDIGSSLPGALGPPLMVGCGTLEPGTMLRLTLGNALPGSTAWFVVGASALNAPFKGGMLVPFPDLFIGLPTTASLLHLPATWPSNVPGGFSVFVQAWVVDASGPAGFTASNALRGDVP